MPPIEELVNIGGALTTIIMQQQLTQQLNP